MFFFFFDKVGVKEANETHFNVGKKVRQTISELGGTMPEDLPTPEKSIQQVRKEHRLAADPTQISMFDD